MKHLREIHDWVAENLTNANQRQAAHYNLRRRPIKFKVGDLVLKRQHVLSSAAQGIAAKLAPKFAGPFRVGRVLSSTVYELLALDKIAVGKVHVSDLKLYHGPFRSDTQVAATE